MLKLNSMQIKVLGPGCPNCENLAKAVFDVLAEMDVNANVEKVKSLEDIRRYKILATPGLVIDDEVVSAGRIPSKSELRGLIEQAQKKLEGA
jgi:small redox-active disulfide protein 2